MNVWGKFMFNCDFEFLFILGNVIFFFENDGGCGRSI